MNISSINFNVVIFNFYSWKRVFFERIGINTICITISIIKRKNEQSFDSLITLIRQFSYRFFTINKSNLYFFIVNKLYLLQYTGLLNTSLNCFASFALSSVAKVTSGTSSFASGILKVALFTTVALALAPITTVVNTQFSIYFHESSWK